MPACVVICGNYILIFFASTVSAHHRVDPAMQLTVKLVMKNDTDSAQSQCVLHNTLTQDLLFQTGNI